MKIRIDVGLKPGVLDPQGKAIEKSLAHLGFAGVSDLRVGKTITLEVEANDEAEAVAKGKEMAQKLLANLVIEDFVVSMVR